MNDEIVCATYTMLLDGSLDTEKEERKDMDVLEVLKIPWVEKVSKMEVIRHTQKEK